MSTSAISPSARMPDADAAIVAPPALAPPPDPAARAAHAAAVLGSLHRLRLTHDLCDVWLECGARCFAAHRVVLAAASAYFHAMFVGGLAESGRRSVTVHGVGDHCFSLLIHFIYTGELSVTETNCQDLLCAADMLQLPAAVDSCCKFLADRLAPDNCVGISQLAETHGCTDLLRSSEDYICAHFPAVVAADEFVRLSVSSIVRLLAREELAVASEACVLSAAVRWLSADASRRRGHVAAVLASVRLSLVSPAPLAACLRRCPDTALRLCVRKAARQAGDAQDVRRGARRTLYVVGGFRRDAGATWSDSEVLDSVYAFCGDAQRWTALAPLLLPRSGHAVAACGGAIYAIGGEHESLIYAATERYDVETRSWHARANMTQPRCGLGVCTVGAAIYAIGGWVGSEIGRSIERYDPQLDVWKEVDTLQKLRFAMGIVECGGLIYVIGGVSELGSELCDVESYNPVTRQWQRLQPLHTARAYMAVTAHDGHVYAAGGCNETTTALDSVELYSVEKDEWSVLPAMQTARAGATAAVLGGRLYVAGGRTTGRHMAAPLTLASVECYDGGTRTWSAAADMPESRCEGAAVVI